MDAPRWLVACAAVGRTAFLAPLRLDDDCPTAVDRLVRPPPGRPAGSSAPYARCLTAQGDSSCPVPGPALARTLRMQPARPTQLDPAVVLIPAGSSSPIRREIRRFAASIRLPRGAPRLPPGRSGRHGPGRRWAGRFVQLRKEHNRSLRGEDPKGRNRKERCSSGLKDPARPTADRTVSTRSGSRPDSGPAKHRFKKFYSRLKPDLLGLCAFTEADQALCGSAPPDRRLPSPCARTSESLPSGFAASPRPGTLGPASQLSLPLSYRFSTRRTGLAAFRSESVTVPARWPATTWQPPRTLHWVLGPPLTASRSTLRAIREPPIFGSAS